MVSSSFKDQHNQRCNEIFQKRHNDKNSNKNQSTGEPYSSFTEEEKSALKLLITTSSQYDREQRITLFKAINNGVQAYQTELNKINKGLIVPANTPR